MVIFHSHVANYQRVTLRKTDQTSMAPGFLPASRSSKGVHRFTGLLADLHFFCGAKDVLGGMGWDYAGWWFQTFCLFSYIYGKKIQLTNSYFSRWLLHHQAV